RTGLKLIHYTCKRFQTTFTLYSCNKTSICLLSVVPALFTVFERQYCHEDP
ncbi:hypothetical protein HMPREF3156_00580, partial [Neisseria sp. HMSC06F02]